MLSQRLLLGIIIGAGVFSVGLSYGTLTQSTTAPDSFDHGVKMQNGKPLFFMDNSTSIARTNTAGANTGTTLTIRGNAGILFATGGSTAYGTGVPIMTVANSGVAMSNGKAIFFTNANNFINKTDTTGIASGTFQRSQAYSGFLFTTGAGAEKVRITQAGNVGIGTNAPVEKLDVIGNEHLTGHLKIVGNVTATPVNIFAIKTTNNKDICIGTGC